LGNIDRGDIVRFKMTIHLLCSASLGQSHYMKAYLDYDNPCELGDRPESSFECQENIGSYDPNDKTLFINGIANHDIIGESDTLEYLIRFQNTGADTAFTVRIEDKFPESLDKRKLYPIVASHNYEWWITNDRLTVLFEEINLVDSTTNEMDSHGFVKFITEVDKNELAAGELVENEANIFFDFNEPIVTNTAKAYYLCKATQNQFEEVSICEGDTYEWNGELYSMNGFYSTTLESTLGCDSVVFLNLMYINSSSISEIPYNGIDDDCDPLTLDDDLDQDGFLPESDCDDNNANINPNQLEYPCSMIVMTIIQT